MSSPLQQTQEVTMECTNTPLCPCCTGTPISFPQKHIAEEEKKEDN